MLQCVRRQANVRVGLSWRFMSTVGAPDRGVHLFGYPRANQGDAVRGVSQLYGHPAEAAYRGFRVRRIAGADGMCADTRQDRIDASAL